MQNARWMSHKLESRLSGKISTTSDMQMLLPKWKKINEEELKSLLMKTWLKIQQPKNQDRGTQSHHFMSKIGGWKIETVADFIFLDSKITADGD